MRWGLAVLLGAVMVSGCGRSDSPAAATSAAAPQKADPGQELYEKVHAGAFQADAALESLGLAVEALRPLPNSQGGETKEALLNVLDMLDSAGRTLAEHNEPLTLEGVRADPGGSESLRKVMVEDAQDALQETTEAKVIIEEMLASEPPEKEKAALTKADEAIADTLDALEDGIRLMGGKVEGEGSK